MRVNQAGNEIHERQLFAYIGQSCMSEQDRDDAITLLCSHLGVEIWMTNATKHGNTELQLRNTS